MYIRMDRVRFILIYYSRSSKELCILLWIYMILWWRCGQVAYIATGASSFGWWQYHLSIIGRSSHIYIYEWKFNDGTDQCLSVLRDWITGAYPSLYIRPLLGSIRLVHKPYRCPRFSAYFTCLNNFRLPSH